MTHPDQMPSTTFHRRVRGDLVGGLSPLCRRTAAALQVEPRCSYRHYRRRARAGHAALLEGVELTQRLLEVTDVG